LGHAKFKRRVHWITAREYPGQNHFGLTRRMRAVQAKRMTKKRMACRTSFEYMNVPPSRGFEIKKVFV